MNTPTRLLLLPLALGCTTPPAAPDVQAPAPPPSQLKTTLDGGTEVHHVTAKQIAAHIALPGDKTRLYNFWASWCGPCIIEMPRFAQLGRSRADVEIWMVNVDTLAAANRTHARIVAKRDLGHLHHMRHAKGDAEVDPVALLSDFPDILPVTYVVQPTGRHAMTLVGAVSASDLDQAIGSQ